MHDTAHQIGTLAMQIYSNLPKASVLEIGSQAVNGSLRVNALPTTRYVGVDLEEGEGVDIVVESGKPLPLDDDSFNLVMASSVFEHDPAFWLTFLEMCRVTKMGGYIYINAPSNGIIHRYPMDNWRFYPDAGIALVQWAVSQGQAMTLVESFVADRHNDIWNDFVAVFRKGGSTRNLPKNFIYERISCANVHTWKTSQILAERNATEDLLLLDLANDRAAKAEQSRVVERGQVDSLREENRRLELRMVELEHATVEHASVMRTLERDAEQYRLELTKQGGVIQQLRDQTVGFGEQLLARDTTIAQLRAGAEQLDLQIAALRRQINDHAREQERLQAQVLEHSTEAGRLGEELTKQQYAWELERQQLIAKFEVTQCKFRETQSELADLSNALVTATSALQKERDVRDAERSNSEWLQKLSDLLLSTHGKWRLLSTAARRRRLRNLLRQECLFDSEAYAARNTDVVEERLDPLHHYLAHGLREGRSRDF